MEAIFILTELKTAFAREQLRRVASHERFRGDERRQAAIWGLGKAGPRSYDDLVPFIGDAEENTAYHAIVAFGPGTPKNVIEKLVRILVEGNGRSAPAASEALRVIDTPLVLQCLVDAVNAQAVHRDWALATIGRLSPDMVRTHLRGTSLLDQLAPMLLLAPSENWLANEDASTNMTFLLKQRL